MAISNRVGPPVTGDDFYGRKSELKRAHEYLDSKHSLVLSAPRRIGKSSFAKKLIEEQKDQKWTCVYIDLEGVQTRDEFLSILIKSFEKSGIWSKAAHRAGSVVNKIIDGVKEVGPLKFDFSNNKGIENLYSSLAEAIDHTKDTLVVVDELTLFLSSLARNREELHEVSFLLNWFRSLRQVTGSKIRWIFCGSVGLHNFTSMHRLSMTINDMLPFDFDALTPEEARGLIMALAESENLCLTEGNVDYILSKIEWYIPFFIQLVFTNIKKYPNTRAGVDDMYKVIDGALGEVVESETLSTWSERLVEYNNYEDAARWMLNELCKADTGLSKSQLLAMLPPSIEEDPIKADTLVSTVLNMLEHDGYVARSGGGVRRFRSPLLRHWWYYHFIE